MDFVNSIINALGFTTMNIVGGIIFVVATVMFVGELLNYRFYLSRPFVRKTTTKWDAMSLVIRKKKSLTGTGMICVSRKGFGKKERKIFII